MKRTLSIIDNKMEDMLNLTANFTFLVIFNFQVDNNMSKHMRKIKAKQSLNLHYVSTFQDRDE